MQNENGSWKWDMIRQRARKKGFKGEALMEAAQEVAVRLVGFRYDTKQANGADERVVFAELADRNLAAVQRDWARHQKAMQRYRDRVAPELGCGEPDPTERRALQMDVREAINRLSGVEREVCQALARQKSRLQIAKDLGLSRYDVDRAVERIRDRLRGWGLGKWVVT